MGRKKKLPHEKRDRSEYNKNYYLEKRDLISERRKNKYRDDPEYRKKILEASRVYKNKKKEEFKNLIEKGIIKKKKRKSVDSIIVEINGKKKVAYQFPYMVKQIKRSGYTINSWIRLNIFPRTPILKSNRFRFYTEEMIFVIKMAIQRRGEISPKDKSFYDEIHEGWNNLGVFGDIKYM